MAVVTLTNMSLILDPAVKEIECIHVMCDARKVWWRQIAMAKEAMVNMDGVIFRWNSSG